MPDQGNSSSDRTPPNQHRIDIDLAVSDEVLARVFDQLDVTEDNQRADLQRELREIASVYQAEMIMEVYRGVPSQEKDAIRALICSLDASLKALSSLPPEYLVQIERMACRGAAETPPRPEPQRTISDLRDAAATFLAEYRPKVGPPANFALEEALRALLAFVEDGLSRSVTVSQNKHGLGGPRLKSKAAIALGIFLQALDSATLERTIVNMVQKIRKQPESTEHPSIAIFRADPNCDLDCSLLGNRTRDN